MARIIRLNEAFTDTSLPILRDDPILVSPGSLVLMEPGHPASPLAVGVPASGATLANIAWKEAQALIASQTQASLAGSFYKDAAFSSTLALAERSLKGGIHGIVTQSAWTASNFQMAALLASPIYDYIRNNPTRAMFISVWGRLTRQGSQSASTNSGGFASINRFSGSNVGPWMLAWTSAQLLPNTGRLGTRSTGVPTGFPSTGTPGPMQYNIAAPSPDTAGNAYSTPDQRNIAHWGRGAGESGASFDNKWPSWLWYRTYVEDLTSSGRSYAAVDALDTALFTQHVLTAGGRYFGDTFTAPSTLA